MRRLRPLVTGDVADPRWRARVARALRTVGEGLDRADADDAWALPGQGCAERRRRQLGARVGLLLAGLDGGAVGPAALRRLVTDLEHALQRDHDAAWDRVALELGGSE